MKKYLAICGLGFVFGAMVTELIGMYGALKEAKEAEKEALAMKAAIRESIQKEIYRHDDWTEEEKQQLRDWGYSVK